MSASFQVLEGGGADGREWQTLFDAWPGRDLYAHPEYLSLYEEDGGTRLCVIYHCREGRVIYPILLRKLATLSYCGRDREDLHDVIASPQGGYGGPFVETTNGGDKSALLAGFYQEYERWARAHSVVSEYVTFTPFEEAQFPYPGESSVRMPVVVRTLDLSPDEIFQDYKKSVRNNIRAAQKAGVQIEVDFRGDRVDEFLDIYQQTMNRRGAGAGYHLSSAFMERFNRVLAGHYAYFFARLSGKVVSVELVTVSAGSIDFFRGGTLAESFPAHPNHLLRHHIILWGCENGKRAYFLGGGNDGEDPLYQYKLSFAPGGRRPLRVGKWVLDHSRYDRLVAARRAYEQDHGFEWIPKPGYFPEYRAPAATPPVLWSNLAKSSRLLLQAAVVIQNAWKGAFPD
jgi:hypothetical protein